MATPWFLKPSSDDQPPGDGDAPAPGDGDAPAPGDGDAPAPGDGDAPAPTTGGTPWFLSTGAPAQEKPRVERVRAALPPAPLDTASVLGALGQVEGGAKGYDAIGPSVTHPSGATDRAYGKYGVMGANVTPWTQEILGTPMTPEQFVADPQAQDKVAAAKLQQYYAQTGSTPDALSMWHSGVPLAQAQAEGRRDVNMTTPDYVNKVMGSIKVPDLLDSGPAPPAPTRPGAEPPAADPRDEGITFSQVGQPKPAAPADTPDDPNLSFGSALKQGIHNYPGSALDVLSNTAHAVMNFGETSGTLGKLGSGIVSQVAGGLGVSQDPAAKAQTEQVLNALEDHYKQTYGSWAGFKNALAKHPADVTMDLALPFTTLTGAVADAGGMVGKVASLAGKVVTPVLNPIEGAVTMAKGLGSIAAPVIRGAQSVATGVPSAALKLATQAGATSDPLLRQAFTSAMKGQIDPVDLLQRTQSALSGIRDDASKAYMAGKAGLADAEPSFSGLDDALAKARSDVTLGSGGNDAFARPNQALDEAQGMIDSLRNDKGISSANIDQFDTLKKAIWDLRDQYSGSSVAQQHLGSLYAAAKQAIVDVDPKYAALMEQYQTGRNNITNIQKTLGAGPNAVANATLAKQLKALKTPQGQDLLTQIAGKDPTVPYMLAGSALQPWHRGGFADLLEVAMGAGLASFTHPVALGLPLVAGSPKLAGLANYGAGLAQRAGAAAATAPAEYGASVLGNPDTRQQPPVARAAGGRTGVNHAARAATLVRAAETARRQQAQGTKVLLNQPDEAITRALAVANRSI